MYRQVSHQSKCPNEVAHHEPMHFAQPNLSVPRDENETNCDAESNLDVYNLLSNDDVSDHQEEEANVDNSAQPTSR